MTVIDQFKLKNNSNNKEIKFHFATRASNNITVNNIAISSAGASATSNFVANFGGFKRLIGIDFTLYNDGTDKSSDASSIITLSQQEDFLHDVVLQGVGVGDSQSDVTYTLTIWRDSTAKTYIGGIEDITTDSSPSTSGIKIQGSLNLIVGTN